MNMTRVLLYMMLFLLPHLAFADAQLEELVQKLQKKYSTLEGFKANFTLLRDAKCRLRRN